MLNLQESKKFLNIKNNEVTKINGEYDRSKTISEKKIVLDKYIKIVKDIESENMTSEINGTLKEFMACLHYNIGVCCIKIRDFKLSIFHNKKSVFYDSNKANAYYNLALSYVGMYDNDSALCFASKAFELSEGKDRAIELLLNRLIKATTINPILKELAEL